MKTPTVVYVGGRKNGQVRAGESLNYSGDIMTEEEGTGFSSGKKVEGLGDSLAEGDE